MRAALLKGVANKGLKPLLWHDKFLLLVLLGAEREDTTSVTETTFREDASRSVGVTGRREAAVPVKASPARGQSDRTRGVGKWGSYPGDELGVGYDMPLPRLALKHTAVTQFSGKNPEIHCLDQRRQVLRQRNLRLCRIYPSTFP